MKATLFNPFLKIAGEKAFAIACVFVLLSSILAYFFNTHFDGVLDVHYSEVNHWSVPFIENGINILSLFLIFYIFGLILTKGRVRWIDILGTTMLARYPFVIMPFGNIGNYIQNFGEKILENPSEIASIQFSTLEITYFICFTILSIFVVIWYISLLFNAYKISTNLKKGTLIGSFIFGLLLAEIVSKIIIYKIV